VGYDSKYGNIETEFGTIPPDERVIVFRARDKNTIKLLAYYLHLCAKSGSPVRHLHIIIETLRSFRQWQDEHPDQVRNPDSARSRAWMGEHLSVELAEKAAERELEAENH
jgi:hypothetical protein